MIEAKNKKARHTGLIADGITKLAIVPGTFTPREYMRRFIDQNGLSQRELGRMVGSNSTGFINRVLQDKVPISSAMAHSIGSVMFSSIEDVATFVSLVEVDKVRFKKNEHRVKALRSLVS